MSISSHVNGLLYTHTQHASTHARGTHAAFSALTGHRIFCLSIFTRGIAEDEYTSPRQTDSTVESVIARIVLFLLVSSWSLSTAEGAVAPHLFSK